MRFLVDENHSPKRARLLQNAGHDIVHIRNIGLASATDQTAIDTARVEDRVRINADTDFGTLLARSQQTRPSFLLIPRASGRRATEQARSFSTTSPPSPAIAKQAQ